MSSYIRPRRPGATIFFTVALAQRGSSLLVEEVDHLRAAVGLTRKQRPFHVDAWVVLPDHMHCVWTLPDGDADFSTRWGAIKSRFTRSVKSGCRVGFYPTTSDDRQGGTVGWNPTLRRSPSKVRKGDAGVWQRRFWEHHIRDEADWRNHVEYCYHNPVKHGYVTHPKAWPFSSIHRDIENGP